MSSNIQLRITDSSTNASSKANESSKTNASSKANAKEETQNKNISLYIEQLTEQQKIVLNIAKDHLATSFCIEKSLGYLNWLKSQQQLK